MDAIRGERNNLSGQNAHDPVEGGCISSGDDIPRDPRKSAEVQPTPEARERKQGSRHGSKPELLAAAGIEKRTFSDRITHEGEPFVASGIDREGEVADDPVQTVFTPAQPSLEQQGGIGGTTDGRRVDAQGAREFFAVIQPHVGDHQPVSFDQRLGVELVFRKKRVELNSEGRTVP